jgi:hypothetical protein
MSDAARPDCFRILGSLLCEPAVGLIVEPPKFVLVELVGALLQVAKDSSLDLFFVVGGRRSAEIGAPATAPPTDRGLDSVLAHPALEGLFVDSMMAGRFFCGDVL